LIKKPAASQVTGEYRSNQAKQINKLLVPPVLASSPLPPSSQATHEDMSAFTFTAPIMSDEEARSEMKGLSEEERERVRNDLFGTSSGDKSAAAARSEEGEQSPQEEESDAVRAVRRAIDAIPECEKRAYGEALQRVPHLVQRESPLAAYLRGHGGGSTSDNNWNAQLVARKVVQYWTVRTKLFGGEKAHLPMTLGGAIAADDLQYFDKGAFVFPLPDDKRGRPVLFYDRIRSTKDVVPST